MAITKEFAEAVGGGKLLRVRIMLKDILLVDPSLSMFDEMEAYASARMKNLYDPHNKDIFNYDKTSWNEDYLNEQMVIVVNNFSKERIEFLKNIVRYLYRDKIQSLSSKQSFADNQLKSTRKTIGIGGVVAGTALSITGICTSYRSVTIGGIAVFAIGVALLAGDRR